MKNSENKKRDRVVVFLSNFLSPPVLSIFIFLAISLKISSSLSNTIVNFLICFLFQSLFPIILLFVSLRMKTISDIHMYKKEERNKIFPVLAVYYFSGYGILKFMKSPDLLSYLMLSSTVLILLTWGINLKYKISIHAIGVGGFLTGMYFAFGISAVILEVILLPLIIWIRYESKAHNLLQIITGVIVGHLITYIVLSLFL